MSEIILPSVAEVEAIFARARVKEAEERAKEDPPDSFGPYLDALEFDGQVTGLDIGPLYPLPDKAFASLLVHVRNEDDRSRRGHLVEMVKKHEAKVRALAGVLEADLKRAYRTEDRIREIAGDLDEALRLD